MIDLTYNSRLLIPLPYPRPRKVEDGRWKRTWKLSLCRAADRSSLVALEADLRAKHFDVTVSSTDRKVLEVAVFHQGDPFSDANFVIGPRQMFLLIEAKADRIESIENVARSLWPPFRPAFHILIPNMSESVRLTLEMIVRFILDQRGWEHGVVALASGQRPPLSEINYARVSELSILRNPLDTESAIHLAVFRQNVVLMAERETPEVLSYCRQLETSMKDRYMVGMAYASWARAS
jgi:hypothetical protein